MLVKVTHETTLSYDDAISESAMELRMSPRQEDDQLRLSFTLAVGPATAISSHFDWLGNTVHALTINGFHRQMRVLATSVVQTNRKVPAFESLPDIWRIPRDALDYSMFDYLQLAAGPIVDAPELRQLANAAAANPGERLAPLAMRLMTQLHSRFAYKKGVTTAASPITEILEHGGGVCQDFAHLLIGLARALGIPARYVSGYIYREHEAIRGHAQTHAWCEMFFPSHGWIGFDPTNNCLVGDGFIKIAHGRDFRDVSPNRGVFRGSAKEDIAVGVRVEALSHIPPALVAERFEAIPLDVFQHRREEHLQVVSQQQEQQQQELRQQQEQQQQQGVNMEGANRDAIKGNRVTYCLGIVTRKGLVLASDSRTNAGADQINIGRKMHMFEKPGDRVFAPLSAGSLSCTQSVLTLLRRDFDAGRGLASAANLYDASRVVGNQVRMVAELDRAALERDQIAFNVTFLLAGQIKGEPPSLFMIYPQGNPLQASPETPFLQIGETKYGRPILDRGIRYEKTSLEDAAKYALLSLDSTMRSNVTVGPPIDLLAYETDALRFTHRRCFKAEDPDLLKIRNRWEQALRQAVQRLPTVHFRDAPETASSNAGESIQIIDAASEQPVEQLSQEMRRREPA